MTEDVLRHQYRTLTDEEKEAVQAVKDAGLEFLNTVTTYGAPGRETSLARTRIEEAVMWAVKGIKA